MCHYIELTSTNLQYNTRGIVEIQNKIVWGHYF